MKTKICICLHYNMDRDHTTVADSSHSNRPSRNRNSNHWTTALHVEYVPQPQVLSSCESATSQSVNNAISEDLLEAVSSPQYCSMCMVPQQEIRNRAWNASKDPIILARAEVERLGGEEAEHVSQSGNAIYEMQELRPKPATHHSMRREDTREAAEASSNFRNSSDDRTHRVLALASLIWETVWRMVTDIRELSSPVLRWLYPWPSKADIRSKTDESDQPGSDAIKQLYRPNHPLFRSTPHLQIEQDLGKDVYKLEEVLSSFEDASPCSKLSFPANKVNVSSLADPEPLTVNLDACREIIDPAAKENHQPLHVPLSYKIQPDATQQRLLKLLPEERAYWQYHLYRGPNGEKVKVHYCRNLESTERVAGLFINERVLGFDLEWIAQASAKDGIRKNVSLIQLASQERIALFHVGIFHQLEKNQSLITPTLKKIMESPQIAKVGVAIKADTTRLRTYLGVESRGIFELSHLHKLVKSSCGSSGKVDKRLVSLAQQVEEHLDMPLWKGSVRSSDWTKPLNMEQVEYAASDAYAALHLYDALEKKRKALDPTPPCPAYAELNLPIRLAHGVVIPVADEEQAAIEDEGWKSTVVVSQADFIDETPRSVSRKSVPKSTMKPPQVVVAETWVCEYRAGVQPPEVVRASASHLRAYALWHCHQESIEDIANLLRDPPLQRATVANYILEAVRLQKLTYDADRMRDVLACLPAYGRARYRHIVKDSW